MAKKTRLKLYGKDDFNSKFKNNKYYPAFVIGSWIVAVIIFCLIVVFVIVPVFKTDSGEKKDPVIIKDYSDANSKPTIAQDLYSLVNERLLKIKFVNSPYMFNDKIICSGGVSSAGNPSLKNIYIFTINGENVSNNRVEIEAENDNFLYPIMNEKYIAYVDSKNDGGGNICVYNTYTNKKSIIKEYNSAAPKIYFSGNKLVWFEEIAANLSSVYVYDIDNKNYMSIVTQENLPFVYGGIGVDENKIAYIDLQEGDTNLQDLKASNKTVIKIFDISTGETKIVNPDMYAYAPQIKGDNIAFIDTNENTNSCLYLISKDSPKKKIGENVVGYYLGDGFIVYCSNDRVFVYFLETQSSIPLTKESQKGLFIGGSENTAFWYDITSAFEKDIVKYAKLESGSWQE